MRFRIYHLPFCSCRLSLSVTRHAVTNCGLCLTRNELAYDWGFPEYSIIVVYARCRQMHPDSSFPVTFGRGELGQGNVSYICPFPSRLCLCMLLSGHKYNLVPFQQNSAEQPPSQHSVSSELCFPQREDIYELCN